MRTHQNAVLIINLAKWFGGAEVRVLETAAALDGVMPYGVATLSNSPLHRKLIGAGLKAFPLPFSRGDIRLAGSIHRIIREKGFTCVDMHNPQSHFWGLLASKTAGLSHLVTTVHNSSDSTVPHLKTVLNEAVLRLNAFAGSRFVAVSRSVHDHLTSLGIPSNRISIIPNGINMTRSPEAGQREALRRHWGWNQDDYIVLAVGRLEAVKGHRFLVDAMPSIARLYPHVRCLLVGEGRQRESLQARVEALHMRDHIRFTGFCENIHEIMMASDLFCMPSLSEGLPYALLEACACRLPLVVTNVGGMTEFLKKDKTAVMVAAQSAEKLSGGITRMIEHPDQAKTMGQAAFASLQRRFDADRMLSRTVSVYSATDVDGRWDGSGRE